MPRSPAAWGGPTAAMSSATIGTDDRTVIEYAMPVGTRVRSGETTEVAGSTSSSGSTAAAASRANEIRTCASRPEGLARTSRSCRPEAESPIGKRHCRARSLPRLAARPRRPSLPSRNCDCSAMIRPRRTETCVATVSTRGTASWIGTETRVRRGTTMPCRRPGARRPVSVTASTSTIASSGNGLNSASHSSEFLDVVPAAKRASVVGSRAHGPIATSSVRVNVCSTTARPPRVSTTTPGSAIGARSPTRTRTTRPGATV